MIAILSRQWLLWLGLQTVLDGRATVQMVVSPHQWRIPDRCPTETRPDVVILDLETEHDAIGTINQIRASSPTSKIVLLWGLEDQSRTREAFATGVDGIILTVQPPTVMLTVFKTRYTSAQPKAYGEREGTVGLDLAHQAVKTKSDADTSPLAWPNALTERQR